MNSSKNSFRENQLNSNSTLFLQLGIILALIIVYSFFELEFSKNIIQLPSQTGYEDDLTFIIPNFKLKKEIPEKEIEKKKPLDLSNISIDDTQKDDAPKVEISLLDPPTNDINRRNRQNITARSLLKNLEKEAIRVIGKLPKMIPGKQHDKNVSVKYNLPISFYIK